MAVPGVIVGSGKLITPGGDQGLTGASGPAGPAAAWTSTTGSAFVVPPIGQTVTVSVADTSWATVGEVVWIGTANGGGNAGAMRIQALTPTSFTFINIGSSTPIQGDMLKSVYDTNNNSVVDNAETLINASGNTTDFIDGTTHSQNLAAAVQPIIWSVRLQSFNALGNPTFEIDQRTAGAGTTVTNGYGVDRWKLIMSSGIAGSLISTVGQVVFPGTNFAISNNFLRFNLTTQKSTLASNDLLSIYHTVEGINLREIFNDVHSVGILARSSVANTAFSVNLTSSNGTRWLAQLFTLSAANTWTWFPWLNLQSWAAGLQSTMYNLTPGLQAYTVEIALAAGSTYLGAASNVWVANGSGTRGVTGMSNFAGNPTGSTFDLAFVQNSPGPTIYPIDKPFNQNYDECLRYFWKSHSYGVAPTAAASKGSPGWLNVPWPATSSQIWVTPLPTKPLAKTPTLTAFSFDNGTVNAVSGRLLSGAAGGDQTVTAYNAPTEKSFGYFSAGAAPASSELAIFHLMADTGW